MDTLKKYKVSIFGESYTLVSDESEEQLVASAQHIDELMRQLAEKTGLSDTKRIAVLASLQIACKLKTEEAELTAELTARFTAELTAELTMVREQTARKELELIDRIDRELGNLA